MSGTNLVVIALLSLAACRNDAGGAHTGPGANTAPQPAIASAAAPAASSAAPETTPSASARVWSFDGDAPDGPPKSFSFGRTGEGREGRWLVEKEADAPSAPNVLAQIDADNADYRFPVAFADAPSLRDVDLAVKCKPVSGAVDQACGLVFRLKDPDNYYLTRANALEGNVRLYLVKDGKRKQIAGWNGKVASGVWHELRVVAAGDAFQVYWEGAKVIDHHDATFADAGKVGVWTKADSVTYFDDLTVK